jgi:alkyl sulfatase BDS1-like metallo-beta-lactamase superfamily hydrolase
MVYSHAHADHFGGVKGVISQAQVDSGEVQIIAPKDFMEHAIKKNILAGNAMTRRASYQYGSVLEKSPTGQVDAAIGKGLSSGYIGLIAPAKIIQKDIETLTIDGITMVMQNTPSTESPAKMNAYFPQLKTLWMAENVTGTLHNVYTLRVAEVGIP